MNYALNDRITIIVDKGQGPGLVGDGQGELVVVHQADLLDLAGVVHVVQEDGDAQHFKRLVNFEMSFWCHQTCSCPFVRYLRTLFWDNTTIIC